MAQIKRYRLLVGMGLMTYFVVNGTKTVVNFKNGVTKPYLLRGFFVTDNEDLQKAIEESNGFGKQYKLDQEWEKEVVVKSSGFLLGGPGNAGDPPVVDDLPGKTGGGDPTITDYPEIETVKGAREKLMELYPELKPKDLPNAVQVILTAKEKRISFSKLVLKPKT